MLASREQKQGAVDEALAKLICTNDLSYAARCPPPLVPAVCQPCASRVPASH